MEQGGGIDRGGKGVAAAVNGFNTASLPAAETEKLGKNKIRRRLALAADQFPAAADIVIHPRRQAQMVRVAFDFFGVKGNGGDKVRHVLHAILDQQIWVRHLPPEFCFNKEAIQIGV